MRLTTQQRQALTRLTYPLAPGEFWHIERAATARALQRLGLIDIITLPIQPRAGIACKINSRGKRFFD